jgi:hypothetical protein
MSHECEWFYAMTSLQRVSYGYEQATHFGLCRQNGFLQFKEQVPYKFENKISVVQCKRKTL